MVLANRFATLVEIDYHKNINISSRSCSMEAMWTKLCLVQLGNELKKNRSRFCDCVSISLSPFSLIIFLTITRIVRYLISYKYTVRRCRQNVYLGFLHSASNAILLKIWSMTTHLFTVDQNIWLWCLEMTAIKCSIGKCLWWWLSTLNTVSCSQKHDYTVTSSSSSTLYTKTQCSITCSCHTS